MSKTELILVKNVVGLGAETDHVKVAPGYARNYLIPRGLAIPLTSANKRRLEVLKQRRAEREAHELNAMNELGRSLSKLTLQLKVKTGEDGKMFGGVTPGLIADELKNQFEAVVDKRKIHLEHPIRGVGDHEVELRLHADVIVKLRVHIESTTPPPAKVEEPAKTAGGKGGKEGASARGDRPGRGARDAAKTDKAEKTEKAKK
ncbi:MAG: 50S ribosomal protein L9 [Verrucomicrobiales bacterium]|nr:50S ribosomal protein L9 [Verrucomicrobiales bacterium]